MKAEIPEGFIKHPTLPIYGSEDGRVFNPNVGTPTFGRQNSHGYMVVWCQNTLKQVHRLIAEIFIENPDSKPTVDHINRVRNDNRVENLRWATHHEQRENSSQVIERADYGVRSCENKKQYNNAEAKAWYQNHKEYRKAYMRNYYLTHKEKWEN